MLKFDGGNFNVVKKTLMMRSPDFCGIFQVWPNKCGTVRGKILAGENFGELMALKSLARKNLANLLVVY